MLVFPPSQHTPPDAEAYESSVGSPSNPFPLYSMRNFAGAALLFVLDTMGSLIRWLFRLNDTPKLLFPPTVASVLVRKSNKPDDVAEVSLQELVESRCPSLHNEFRSAWWLPKYVFAACLHDVAV